MLTTYQLKLSKKLLAFIHIQNKDKQKKTHKDSPDILLFLYVRMTVNEP